jgi:AcrR family transcriptional regulator
LSIDDILIAALHVVRREGLEAATIKAVAAHLGITSPAVYHYLTGHGDLVARICERVTALVPLEEYPDSSWEEQLVTIVLDMHNTYRRYPGVGAAALTLSGRAPAADRIVRRMLTILRQAGFGPEEASHVVSAVYFFFSGWLVGKSPDLPGRRLRMTSGLLAEGLRWLLAGCAVTRLDQSTGYSIDASSDHEVSSLPTNSRSSLERPSSTRSTRVSGARTSDVP